MNDRKVILYIATSLDGFIAKDNNDISFLSTVEVVGEDYGYSEFIKTIDIVIMGRKTYDKVLSFGVAFPHKDKKCYVLSQTRTGKDENVEFFNGDVGILIQKIRKSDGLNIFIDGGSELIHELMKQNLIDRFIISVIPHMLGGGIKLFNPGRPELTLKLIRSSSFPSGLVQLEYERGERLKQKAAYL